MYKRLIILSAIILGALGALTLLGYHAVEKWAEGLEWKRVGEFADVAEQIRQDVKRKLDEFRETEQNRPYTHYQYYYVPENVAPGQQQMPVLRSPLADRIENDLAYGYFQINPDGVVITPNDGTGQREREDATGFDDRLYAKVLRNRLNIENNLLPMLNTVMRRPSGTRANIQSSTTPSFEPKAAERIKLPDKDATVAYRSSTKGEKLGKREALAAQRKKALPIESLQEQQQEAQIITQRREVAMSNVAQTADRLTQQALPTVLNEQAENERSTGTTLRRQVTEEQSLAERPSEQATKPISEAEKPQMDVSGYYLEEQLSPQKSQADTVQIQIAPFVPVVVGGGDAQQSIFGRQVFLVRHVQIEDKHFLQGFQLNEKKLMDEVEKSAERFMREGMGFELLRAEREDKENGDVAYTAILDFGFGDLVLNLKEIDPAWLGKQISQLRNWYFSIVMIVLLAVTLGLAGLWRNARAQIKLVQKKDDFISAVSHELRTPLTSIRMYSEMLEKNWVKSQDKVAEYYTNMRQESERLSRLIENVLDFSRIQRGQKKYTFRLGDINEYIAAVVEMMTPYATENGFSIKTDFQQIAQTAFDNDAVTQIVVNLLDNAIKYARDTKDKTITVRTRSDGRFVFIEVEDHGPGVPHRQQEKIFEEFYRIGSEATREAQGTGLGLALVKKFAQAHNGFVEILNTKPMGAIFRVGLAVRS